MTVTVLNRSIGTSGFSGSLVLALRQEAERTRQADRDGFLKGRITALTDLADYCENYVRPDDPQLCALHAIAGAFGDPDAFDASKLHEHQAMVFSGVGRNAGGPLPTPSDLFSDFLLGGVLDLHADFGGRVQKNEVKIAALEHSHDEAEKRATEAETDLRQARLDLAEAHEKIAQLNDVNETLRGLLPSYEAAGTETYRRKSFERNPEGVFETKRKDGTIAYEVKVGRADWQTFPEREAAIAFAESLRAEKEPASV